MISVFSTQKILTPSGRFKTASELRNGDAVITATGKAHTVYNVKTRQKFNGTASDLVCVRSKWWSSPLWLHKDQQVVTRMGTKTASKINVFTDQHLFPSLVQWDIPSDLRIAYNEGGDITSDSFSLGYVFGAFMVCGIINHIDGAVKLKLPQDARSNNMGLIADHLRIAFPHAPHHTFNNEYNTIHLDPSLQHVFTLFDNDRISRSFPSMLMTTKSDYLYGVYQSIVDLTGYSASTLSPSIYEIVLLATVIINNAKKHDTMIAIPFSHKVQLSDSVIRPSVQTSFEVHGTDSVIVDTLIYRV